MSEFYTLQYAKTSKNLLRKEIKIFGVTTAVLLCTAVLAVLYRDSSNHVPALVCVVWVCGVWFLMFRFMEKIMPLKRDIVFCKMMRNSSKKELIGRVLACNEEITMHQMSCYNLKISIGTDEEKNTRQVYLDKRFKPENLRDGCQVEVLVAKHFVFALEVGGNRNE